ncbi:hypothetical protein F164LOC_10310 [Pectobacterium carotovorum]|nr:hypothetical protein F164LOC_10310 [Pectobacterium carotovorum]
MGTIVKPIATSATRDRSVDSLKGIGILLVVLGHVTMLPQGVHDFIYSFHIPLFFILSGYLYNPNKKQSIAQHVTSKFHSLLVPAWIMGLICGIPFIFLLLFGKISTFEFVYRLYGTLVGIPKYESTFICTPIWFLFSLFFTSVIFQVMTDRLKRAGKYVALTVGLIYILSTTYFKIQLPFNIGQSLAGLMFFSMGVFYKSIANELNTMKLALFVFIFLSLYYVSSPIDISANIFGDSIFVAIVNISISCMAFIITKYISKKISCSMLVFFGSNTIPIIGFNYYINTFSTKTLSLLQIENVFINFTFQIIIMFLLIMLIGKVSFLKSSLRVYA